MTDVKGHTVRTAEGERTHHPTVYANNLQQRN